MWLTTAVWVDSHCLDGLKPQSNKSNCLLFRRFIPYCSSDVWSGTGPAPAPPPRQRQGREKERETNTNTSTFSSDLSRVSLIRMTNLRLLQLQENTIHLISCSVDCSQSFDACICYQLSTPSWDPWSSARSSKTSSPKESSRPRLSCWLAQGEFVLPLTLTPALGREPASFVPSGPSPWPNNKQESPYFGCILLSTRNMFTVNCEQWHNVY